MITELIHRKPGTQKNVEIHQSLGYCGQSKNSFDDHQIFH